MNVPILQFYGFAKGGHMMTEDELRQLRDYSLNASQRRELKILLSGLHFSAYTFTLNTLIVLLNCRTEIVVNHWSAQSLQFLGCQ